MKRQKKSQKKITQRWVIKAGSSMVINGGVLLIRSWMQQVYDLKNNHGIEVIWVTSGAIASATRRTKFERNQRTLPEKQALSAIGQPMVMEQYNLSLQTLGLLGAQVLLTAGDMNDRIRRTNLQNTLNELLKWKIVPVLNENDAVATAEIKFGDNDHLAAQVSVMMNAEKLILLTDVDGLYESDPKNIPDAKLVSYLPSIKARDLKLAGAGQSAGVGTGGMRSKLLAAQKAGQKQIVTHLVRGDIPHNLLSIAQGNSLGTQIGGRE